MIILFQHGKEKKTGKKKKVGFLGKLSRAVLKPRNHSSSVEQPILRPSQAVNDKENIPVHGNKIYTDNFDRNGDPKRSSKRLGILRFQKHP